MAKHTQSIITPSNLCPCESGKPYASCCEALHLGASAPSAEALMRSRYSAYMLELEAYLRSTWHPSTRPSEQETLCYSDTRWLGLSVKQHVQTDATHAMVEFVARYKVRGKAERIHELSRFERLDGAWYYIDGDHLV